MGCDAVVPPKKVLMFEDLLNNLQNCKSIHERLAALNETNSWEQIALALYNIDEIEGCRVPGKEPMHTSVNRKAGTK